MDEETLFKILFLGPIACLFLLGSMDILKIDLGDKFRTFVTATMLLLFVGFFFKGCLASTGDRPSCYTADGDYGC